MIEFTLPFPPSVNRMWRNVDSKTLLSEEGRKYRKACNDSLLLQGTPRNGMSGSLWVQIKAFPPDRRRRDLDNLLKGALDALKHCNVIEDDSCIDKLEIVRCNPAANGELWLSICHWSAFKTAEGVAV